MARLVLSLFALCCTLKATPFVFTTCSAGATVAIPCPLFGLSGPGYDVLAQATATEGPSTSSSSLPYLPGGQEQSATTHSEAEIAGPVVLPLSGRAEARDTVTYNSAGPLRPGFLELDVALEYNRQDVEGAATAMFMDGTHQYTYIGGGGINGSTPPHHCYIVDCDYVARCRSI